MNSRFRAVLRGFLLCALLAMGGTDTRAGVDGTMVAGEALYREGRLATGAPLQAERDGLTLQGSAAACVNCHRRSGLGSYEGSVFVPPILGPYLFRDGIANSEDLTLPHIPGYVPRREAYTAHSLALALTAGRAADGRSLSELMPRYSLDDRSLSDLVAYLKTLSAGPFPGVGERALDFATVVTPDTDPGARAAMLEVLEAFFRARNESMSTRIDNTHAAAAQGYRVARTWHLHVWLLTGPASAWEEQLRRRQAAEPVFALVSGLGRGEWQPVHSFCEAARLPCLFPNLELPVVKETDFYSLYYSRGVLLESDLILAQIKPPEESARATGRIVQVYRSDDTGAGGAAFLAAAARKAGFSVVDRALPPRGGAAESALTRALSGLQPRDVLVLWLRPTDLAALGHPVPAERIFVSGTLANLEEAGFPEAWRSRIRMAYPYDPPDLRRVRENFPHAWFRKQGIALSHEPVQSNTYLTCMILADAVDEMLDAFVPDYLVERIEGMLGNRLSTGYFPRLGLAPTQRFASKGGYLVRFDGADGRRLQADGPWITP